MLLTSNKVKVRILLLAFIILTGVDKTYCQSSQNNDEPIPYDAKSYYGNNLIRYHMLDLIINEFTISYERILKNGKTGIEVPITFGYDKDPVEIYLPLPLGDYNRVNHLVTEFETGANFNFYPGGQGIFKYYLGPGLRYGTGYWYQNVNGDDYSFDTSDPINTGYFKFFLNNGFLLTPVRSFSLSLNGFIGIQHAFEATEKQTQTNYGLSFDLIVRF